MIWYFEIRLAKSNQLYLQLRNSTHINDGTTSYYKATDQVIYQMNQILATKALNASFTYLFKFSEFERITTETLNLPTRHSANFTIQNRNLPAEFDFNFTFNSQNIQKSITSMQILLRYV